MGPVYRASCDECNNAKVKCSKTQECSRCRKNQLKCVYGISKRVGRRAQPIASSHESSVDMSVSTPTVDEWYAGASACAVSEYSNDLHNDLWQSKLEYDLATSFDEYVMEDDNFKVTPELTFSSFGHSNFTPEIAATAILSGVDHSTTHSTNVSGQRSGGYGQYNLVDDCPCLNITLANLSRLQEISKSGSTSLDVALGNNREAVRICATILNCSCTSNSTRLLAVISLITKIISIYKRDCSSWTSLKHRLPFESTEDSPRLMLGSYKLDEGDEEEMKIEIIKKELKKVKRLVADWARKRDESLPTSEQELRKSLVVFLNNQLIGL